MRYSFLEFLKMNEVEYKERMFIKHPLFIPTSTLLKDYLPISVALDAIAFEILIKARFAS